MFAKMTPDTLDGPDSDTSRRLGDLAKIRNRRPRKFGGATAFEFWSTTPRGGVAPRHVAPRHGGLLRAPSTSHVAPRQPLRDP